MNINKLRESFDEMVESNAFLDKFLLPEYDKRNVKNVNKTVERLFGVNNSPTSDLTSELDDSRGIDKVLLMIVDGLGYNRLLSSFERNRGLFSNVAEEGKLAPLTTVFPSTTATVLTSLFTGLSPAEHGIIGYQMFSRKYGVIFNTLDMKPVYGYNREVLLAQDYASRLRPWLHVLEENEISTFIATRSNIVNNGLSQVIYGNHRVLPYNLHSDMLAQIKKTLERDERTFIMCYYGGVDNLSHRYGPHSEEVNFEIESLENGVKNMIDKLSSETKQRTLIMLISDHGVVDVQRTLYLSDYPILIGSLMFPPVGDSRAMFLSPEPNESTLFAENFRKAISGIRLVENKMLIEKGAFGNPESSQQLPSTIGSFAALSEDETNIQYPFYERDREYGQLGAHGGMTAEEMIIPLLSIRLSKLQN